jgi:hypothetical protein
MNEVGVTKMTDLVEIMAQGTMKAYALHANDKGIKVDAEKAVIAMRKVMKDGWAEFKATIKDAIDANMGEPMYRNVMNTFCNAWAVKALTEAK